VDVNLLTIPAFATRYTIHVVVESPRGSHDDPVDAFVMWDVDPFQASSSSVGRSEF
jgi:hypothetical protein